MAAPERAALELRAALFARRGIPWQVVYEGASFRREWLAGIDLLQLRSPYDRGWKVQVESETSSIERSEWDAGDRVSLRATLTTSAGSQAESLPLRSRLVPLDEPDGIPNDARRRIPVAFRRADAEPGDALPLAPETRHEVELTMSLHEVPPGPYLLDGLGPGHPLLLRVRRSPRRESEVQRAAQTAEQTEEIEAVGWQRVASAVPRLRDRLRTELARARTPVLTRLLWALARMGDSESARLLLDAIGSGRVALQPEVENDAAKAEVFAFGPVVVPHLEGVASSWPEAIPRKQRAPLIASALAAARVASPGLDDARMQALRRLAPVVKAPGVPGEVFGWTEANQRDLFLAAVVGVAPRRPREAGEVLALLADRPPVLAQAIDALDPVGWRNAHRGIEADAFESVITATWQGLDDHAPPDSGSALAAEAERLGIALPGRGSALPAGPAEALRELSRARELAAPGAREAVMRRVLASPAARQSSDVVRMAAEAALDLELFDEASRVADRALRLATDAPERRRALFTRSRVRAALGDRAGQAADLEATLPLASDGSSQENFETLQRLRAEPLPGRLRVRARSGRWPWNAVAFDGTRLTARDDLRIERQDLIRGGTAPFAVAPWRVHALAVVGPRSLVAVAEDGSLALLRHGRRRPVWEARVKGWCARREREECTDLGADRSTVVVRDLASQAHAFDTSSGRGLWTRPAAVGPPVVVAESDPVVLATPPVGGRWVDEIVGVHPRTGRTLWSARLSAPARSWAAGARRVAWVDMYGRLRMIDVRTGRDLISRDLREGPPTEAVVTAVTIAPRGDRAYAAVGESLFAVDPNGIAWSHLPSSVPEPEPVSSVRLEAGTDALWRAVQVRYHAVLEAWSPSGARIGEMRWQTPIDAGPRLVDDRVVEVLVNNSSRLLDLSPPPP